MSAGATDVRRIWRVWQELDILEDDASVYKLIGPVLVKQELMEVKNNVTKRVEFIKNDMCVRASCHRVTLPSSHKSRPPSHNHVPLPCMRSARLEGNVKKFTGQSETVKGNISALQKAAQQQQQGQ